MKKQTLKALGLALGLSVASGANAFVYDGSEYTIVDGSSYQNLLNWADFTWQEAKVDAENQGGHLATFGTQAEWDAVVAGLGLDGSPQYWLGGYQTAGSSSPTENWNWVDGTVWSFDAWANREPNDWPHSGENNQENYLMTWGDGSVWNDIANGNEITTNRGYILEKVANVPEPASLVLLGLGLIGLSMSRKRQA